MAAVYADIACMRWMCNRSLARARSGQPTGPDGSLAKLAWGRAEQRLAELAVDVIGPAATLEGPWAYNLVAARQTTIAGGTTEINLNIIGEMGLGPAPRAPADPDAVGAAAGQAGGGAVGSSTAPSGQFAAATSASRSSSVPRSPGRTTSPNPSSSQPKTDGARA